MTLRSKLIRLAHEKPELRPALLPLLKSAEDEPVIKAMSFMKGKNWQSFALYKGRRVDFGSYEGGAAKDQAQTDVKHEKAAYKKDPEGWLKKNFP